MSEELQVAAAGQITVNRVALAPYGRAKRHWRRMQSVARYYEESNGNISLTCSKANISRRAFYRWANPESTNVYHKRFQALISRMQPDDRRLDFAEAVVDHHLSEKNLLAAMFTLKSKGRGRGWNERETVERTVIDIADAVEQLRSIIAKRAEAKGISFREQLKAYLEMFAETLNPAVRAKLEGEVR